MSGGLRCAVCSEKHFGLMNSLGNTYATPIELPVMLRLLRRFEFPRKLGWCERLFGRSLAEHGICWVQSAPGPIWKLDLANSTHRWIVYGSYEGPSLWRWLRAHAGSIRTIVDSGANIGQTVLYFSKYLPSAQILAYEPGASARAWLEESVAANHLDGVTVLASGLSSHSGSSHLGNEGGSELHGAWNKINSTDGETIDMATLDEDMDRLGISEVDLWKLDVEGHETDALRGAERALAAHRIRAIYLELGDAKSESAALLNQHGYMGWNLGNSGRSTPLGKHTPWENALFLPAK
jgi:FkbM family methyltransferase